MSLPDSIKELLELYALDHEGLGFSIITAEKAKISSASAFITNIMHLRILTQKEMRSNFIYILMIGICICDLLLLATLLRDPLMRFIYPGNDCHTISYFSAFLIFLESSLQETTRKTSLILAFLMALLRTLSVMFPTNSKVMTISKPLWAVSSILVVFLVAGCYDSRVYYPHCRIITNERFCEDMDTALISYTYDCSPTYYTNSDFKKKIDACFTIIVAVLYVIVTIALLYQLGLAKKRRKSLRSEKSESHTSVLVVIMTITFFMYALSHIIVFVNKEFNIAYSLFERVYKLSETIPLGFLIFNSYAHCVICLFLSSQYRSVARRLFWWEKKETISVVGVQSITNTSNGTTSAGKETPTN